MNRRQFLIGGAALLTAASPPKVGCQTNGYPLKPGDFPELLRTLDKLKSIGYTGFECNTRFVEGQFGRAAEARRQIEKIGVQFIGGQYSMKQAQADTFPASVVSVRRNCRRDAKSRPLTVLTGTASASATSA